MTIKQAKELQGDYIPNGDYIPDDFTPKFRQVKEHEVYRCGTATAYDPQSGPIFCGRVADFVAPGNQPHTIVAVCKRHI